MSARKRTTRKKVGRRPSAATRDAVLRKAMSKRTKRELMDALVRLARDEEVFRRLAEWWEVDLPVRYLARAARRDIAAATDFDERWVNYNFDYDQAAYGRVQDCLTRLVAAGELAEAMRWSLELMRSGSRQVEASDEGLMSDDIEDCLKPVIKALGDSDMEPGKLIRWCDRMLAADRVGFLCIEELKALRRLAVRRTGAA